MTTDNKAGAPAPEMTPEELLRAVGGHRTGIGDAWAWAVAELDRLQAQLDRERATVKHCDLCEHGGIGDCPGATERH